MKTKVCSKCKKQMSLNQFAKDLTRKDKKYCYCKICTKQYSIKNKEHILHYQEKYRLEHKKERAIYDKNRNQKYKKELRLYHRKYEKERRKKDIEFKLIGNLRNRLYCCLIEKTKFSHTLELLGCSIEFLKQHLEKQFKKGMTWKNWGIKGWHIDHIMPCDNFDLTKLSEQKKCFHWTNLQPLWAEDNLIKHNKILEK